MSTFTRRQIVTAGLGLIAVSALPGAQAARPAAREAPSRFVRQNGGAALSVDGSPFLIVGAQCDVWRAIRQDDKVLEFFDGYQKMNATTVGVDIPWSRIEVEKDRYDFTYLEWFIRQAESRGLKLVTQLMGSNVCGKIQEGPDASPGHVYVPDYIKADPQTYRRIVFDGAEIYDAAGPPMCPNDTQTLERERKYLIALARFLREKDTKRTVILAQVNNETGCWHWHGVPQEKTQTRCHCPVCERKWAAFTGTPYQFMVTSFADYIRQLSDAIVAEYPLPLYLNSPWYAAEAVRIFLERCPNIDVMGIDGVSEPLEPNIVSSSQVSRNFPFAAECPTENDHTRFNLDTLPYYLTIGQLGAGMLLWEAPVPKTVVYDADAADRFGRALYPIKNAMSVIGRLRGSERLAGWYTLKEFGSGHPQSIVVREANSTRTIWPGKFDARLGTTVVGVESGDAGIVAQVADRTLMLATPAASVLLRGLPAVSAESGRYEGDRWISSAPAAFTVDASGTHISLNNPAVVQVRLAS